jgi:hypothetical protein
LRRGARFDTNEIVTGIKGVFGVPFVDLEPYLAIDGARLAEVHDEICLALTRMPVDYTGGSHRSMKIMPPSCALSALVDYGEVIRSMTGDEFGTFVSLADDPRAIDVSRRQELEFGEERAHPLSSRQMLWLKFRFGVYFPWKVYVELIPNRLWTEKAESAGKDFTRHARTFFPKTIALVNDLPFESIGRCNVMGLEAHDHGTVHRDGDPDEQSSPDHFITLCPAGNKRLYLWDESGVGVGGAREPRQKLEVKGRAYWFNDHDYHGVEADPFFRYSLRVDGVFRPELLERIARDHAPTHPPDERHASALQE